MAYNNASGLESNFKLGYFDCLWSLFLEYGFEVTFFYYSFLEEIFGKAIMDLGLRSKQHDCFSKVFM